jgi:hypothetical protein
VFNLSDIEGFEWDDGNLQKNWHAHNVLNIEAEEIFFNQPLFLSEDVEHSTPAERRLQALGRTNNSRYLFVAFTIRRRLIRIISARDMSRKERKVYDEKTQTNSKIQE